MALLLADRVKVRSLSTGTGPVTLTTAVAGFQDFSVIGDGNETYYGITDTNGNWEVGRGTYTSITMGLTTTEYLSRDSVVSSSNNNNLVNFPVGGKNIFCTFPSAIALDLIGGAASDSFKTISVSGQSNVVADTSTDTLTLVAGSGISITTDAITDTITIAGGSANSLVNGSYDITLEADGTLSLPNGSTQRDTGSINCQSGVDTVVYTSSQAGIHTIKLLLKVEGVEYPESSSDADTQSCEMIVAKGFRGPTVVASVYGVVHTSVAPLATFTAEWNVLTSRVEILCRPTSLTNSVDVKSFATEITTSD